MREKTKGDLRKLFKLLKEKRSLWDNEDKYFYCKATVESIWSDVFKEMDRKESEVKRLCLQLRELLRVKKPKKVRKLKTYFKKNKSDWRDLTYLKGVENLRSISSLDIDDDDDSICTVSTMTTDIDSDTGSKIDLPVSDLVTGDPAEVDPFNNDWANGEWTHGDSAFSNLAVSNPDLGNLAVDNLAIDNLAIGDLIDFEPDKVDSAADDSVDNDWADGDRTQGETYTDDDYIGGESPELCWSDSGSDCRHYDEAAANVYCNRKRVTLSTEKPYEEPKDSDEDFLLYYVHPRLGLLHPSHRMAARLQILKVLEAFENCYVRNNI